ncbi:MAG TPA: SpoIIE family protein phosphatase, partial [Miltoncostaeaceae bacterium]|nr:SpoIIE family protein phosphatase [Miltoncostaeaceae bacterium]
VWEVVADGGLALMALQGHGAPVAAPAELPSRLPAAECARTGAPVWLPDRAAWTEQHPGAAAQLEAHGVHAAALVPLSIGRRCLGVVALTFRRERVVDPADRESARVLAEQCAVAMERARLLQATEDDRVVAERLRGVATALAGALDLDEVARVIVEEGRRAFGADAAIVAVRDGDVLRALAIEGYDEAVRDRLASIPLDAGLPLAHAVRTGEHVWLGSRDEWVRRGFRAPSPGLSGAAVAPLVVGGRIIGAVGFRFLRPERTFSSQEVDYLATLAAQCAQALDRARLHQAEHEMAETLQRSLLPSSLPERDHLVLAARYRPGTHGTEAGGDWYEVLDLPDGCVALVVGDVVGKGPSAAAVMGQLRSALAAYLLDGHAPGEALARLNRFAARVPGALATTAVCVVLDTTTGHARYSSAGHPSPVLRDREGTRLLESVGGPPLAAVADAAFPAGEVHLRPGACLLLFSDGLFERRQERLDDGLARLVEVVGGTPAEDVEGLADAVIAGMGAVHAFADDVALVAARLLPAPLALRRPALPAELAGIRSAARRWLREAGVRRAQADDLLIGLGEAASNAVEHAYGEGEPGEVEVSLGLRRGRLELRVRDHGSWRHSEIARVNGGRGLTLMRMVADEVVVDGGPAGTTVTMRARVADGPDVAGGDAASVAPALRGAGDGDPTRMRGEVDAEAVAVLREPLLQRAGEGGDVVVDLREVRYLGSSGVSLLVEVSHACEAAGGRLVVVATPGSLPRRVLALSAVDSVFAVRGEAPEHASR